MGVVRGRPLRTISFAVLLAGLSLLMSIKPSAHARELVLAQASPNVLDMAKEALGLGKTTPESTERTGIPNAVPFLVRFRDTVGALEAGAPVLVLGMRMGSVREVKVTFDAAHARFDIPVTIELDPRPFVAGEPPDVATAKVHEAIAALVRAGLRAELTPANLFTGGLAVALEMRSEAAPVEQQPKNAGPPEIPTTGVAFEPLTARVARLSDRISALPLEQTVRRLDDLIEAARRLVDNPKLVELLRNLAESSESLVPAARQLDPTLQGVQALGHQAREVMTKAQKLIEDAQPVAKETTSLLEQISKTAHSMQLLTDMLERQPEAVLRGKSH